MITDSNYLKKLTAENIDTDKAFGFGYLAIKKAAMFTVKVPKGHHLQYRKKSLSINTTLKLSHIYVGKREGLIFCFDLLSSDKAMEEIQSVEIPIDKMDDSLHLGREFLEAIILKSESESKPKIDKPKVTISHPNKGLFA